MSIIVIGSLNTDLITVTPRLPHAGETLTATSFQTGPGGKGGNQFVACHRLSRGSASSPNSPITVRMIGAVGSDTFGHSLITGLSNEGMDVSGIQVREGDRTGVSTIIVDEGTGENRILFSPGANYSLGPEDFMALPEPGPDLVVLQLEMRLETVLRVLEVASEKRVDVLLNPAPAVRLPEEAYAGITHLILNESEATILSGMEVGEEEVLDGDALNQIAGRFLGLGVKYVVITLGARGAFFSDLSGRTGLVPAIKVRAVVDTTAAGDTFVGAYAGAVVTRKRAKPREDWLEIRRAVEWAVRCAGRTVEKEGAQGAIPWAGEVGDLDH